MAIIGTIIAGKYRLTELLASGTMGLVFEAEPKGGGGRVAVKLLGPLHPGDDALFTARFHREALAASRVDHPNCLRILDFGELPDGLLFMAMELVEGRNLHDAMRYETFGYERVVDGVRLRHRAVATGCRRGQVAPRLRHARVHVA